MADASFSIRIRKFITNPLLCRKQFCLDVIHPTRGNVPKKELKEKLCRHYKVLDPNAIVLFGFKTAFGGGRSTGFGLIYDNVSAVRKFEKKYRLVREGIEESGTRTGRRATKELKNRQKKHRGKDKVKCAGASKKK